MRKTFHNIFVFLFVGIFCSFFKLDQCVTMEQPLSMNHSNELRKGTVRFINPCYPKSSEITEIEILNGSMINFASSGIIGKTIRDFSGINAIPNPLELTHSGLALNLNPKDLFDIVFRLTPNQENRAIDCTIGEKAGKAMLDELLACHGDIIRSYEGFTSLLELPLAIVGANKKEKTDKVFCSELVAILYREIGFIPKHVNVSNVIPEQFGSGAGDFDLLRDFAGSDLRIKHIFGLTDLEAEGVTCCGSFLKFFTSCFWCCPQ